MKRTLWVLSFALLMTAVFVIPARAEVYSGPYDYDSNITWAVDSETWTLTISGEGSVGGLRRYSEHGTTYSMPWKTYASKIKTLVVGEGITEIKYETFSDLTKCTRIELPSTVSTISGGSSSFASGYNYDAHALPAPVNEIAVAEGNPYFKMVDGVLMGLDSTTGDPVRLIRYTTGKTDSTYTVLDTVTTIDHGAFKDEKELEQVVMGEQVLSVGEAAFMGCYKLKSVTLPSQLTVISGRMFQNCSQLPHVDIPEGVETLGAFAFVNCDAITQIDIPESVTAIGDCCFQGAGLTSVDIPDHVVTIGESVFYGCDSLTDVKLPADLQKIKKTAFYKCPLAELELPQGLVSIGKEAFYGCGLTELELPAGLTTMDSGALNGLRDLTTIKVAEDNRSFVSVNGVLFTADMSTMVTYPSGKTGESYIIPDGVSKLGLYAFYYAPLTDIYLPADITAVSRYSFYYCENLQGLYFYGNAPEEISSAVYAPGYTPPTVYYTEGATGWAETWNGCPTAVWTPESTATYTVTYDSQGGSSTPAAQTKTGGVDLVLSSLIPSKTGHTFMGWATAPDAETALYQPGGLYREDADVTLYAVWKADTYIVRFDANGGEGAPEELTKTYNVPLSLPETIPSRTYYEFLGWSTSSAASRPTYLAGGTYSANSDATLYAVWQAVTYTVTYDANGGTGAPQPQTKTAGADLILSAGEPVRTGYEFLGWAVSASAAEAEYQPEDTYAQDADLVLYAVWQRVVTGEEAAVVISSGTAAPGETVTLTASISNNPGLAGFLFELRADTEVFSVASVDGELNVAPGAVCKSGTLLSNATETGWKVMWYHTNNVTANGILFTIELTVAEDAPDGVYTVELICSEDDTVNVEGDLVHLAMTDGAVTVASGMKGDVTGDGKITNSDVIRLARHLVGLTTLTEEQLVWGDVNGDGKVTNSDVIKLARYLIGLTTLD